MRHVHDILNLLKQNPGGVIAEDLLVLLTEKYGKDAIYTTCGDHMLSQVEAIEFVLSRQKVVYSDGRLFINPGIESC